MQRDCLAFAVVLEGGVAFAVSLDGSQFGTAFFLGILDAGQGLGGRFVVLQDVEFDEAFKFGLPFGEVFFFFF